MKLANMRSCSTRNSLGSIRRTTKLDKLRNSNPKTMPTSIIRCRLRTASENSQRNSRQANAVIAQTSSRNAATGCSAATAAWPKPNTTTAWINRYSASKPMMAGVRMRLCVTVWNNTDDTATAYATSSIASSLPPRNGITNDHWPLAPKVMNAITQSSAAAASHSRRAGCGTRGTARVAP
ncbi:hypothetical protein D3C87_1529680 [compost metagenome]